MSQHPRAAFCVLVVACLTMCSGCRKSDGNPVGPAASNLVTGQATVIGSQTVSSGGGSIVIPGAGGPLNGMTIVVPTGAHADSRTYQISSAAIVSHSYGPNVNPVSPLITISNGGGYADDIVTIRIPISIPKDHFAMAFMVDPATGKLDAMPLLEVDSTHVTTATRTFTNPSA